MPKPADELRNYSLVICEKPDAAKKIAEALGGPNTQTLSIRGVDVYLVKDASHNYMVCSALGHLYTVTDPWGSKTTYPILDTEWVPVHLVDKRPRVGARLKVIEDLAKKAKAFIHACDYDLEGETIGYNILKYACGEKQDAYRAKFSTLTSEELRDAFSSLKPGLGRRLAEAGRTRHVIDFIWGVNLSRALSEAYYSSNKGYKMVSMGRVQGPTLNFIVEREVEIRTHLPLPFWSVTAVVEKDRARLEARYDVPKVPRLSEAVKVKEDCEGKIGVISSIQKAVVRQPPPTPFNIGDLQREAYRVFGFSPSQTLGLAERLYLDALISYPRTSSQKIPPSIGYGKILNGLSRLGQYRGFASEILGRPLRPREGFKEDPAHPAIYPTGEVPRRPLDSRENRLYDLIVRRFFAVFGEDALKERVSVVISVSNHDFRLNGRRTLKEGWLRYYGIYAEAEDVLLPPLEEGEQVKVLSVEVSEKFDQPPSRFNQSNLLEKMEKEEIGTKATRADIISTLYSRGYVSGQSMSATDVGFAVVEVMRKCSPSIVSTDTTRTLEKELEGIEEGVTRASDVLERAVDEIYVSLQEIKRLEEAVGLRMRTAVASTLRSQRVLGACPVCKTGELTIIRSKKTRKRFVGCSNYKREGGGCTASAPLPQKGSIKITGRQCKTCGWPIISVFLRRYPWRLCVNMKCPGKEGGKKTEVRAVPKGVSG